MNHRTSIAILFKKSDNLFSTRQLKEGPEGPLLVHAAGNTQAGQNSSQNSYYRLNDKFPSFFFHFVQF